MPDNYKAPAVEKNGLHPRNKHRARYNFDALVKSCPELKPFVQLNAYQDQSVDFADPAAVKMLNKALLMHFYNLKYWDIPAGYLCPPIPGRADYIHYMADLLAECNLGVIPTGKGVAALDIGTGASCVYPIIGNHEYGWTFVGTELDLNALKSAKKIIVENGLEEAIELSHQLKSGNIFTGMINPDEYFDITLCNPPFHSSQLEAEQGTIRKLNNLNIEGNALNFGGQSTELIYPGGEAAFISKMIFQSSKQPLQCFWYSTLVSKKDNLHQIYKALEKVGVYELRTIKMAQGQKQSRIVAWTFLNEEKQKEWSEKRWK